MQTKEHFQVADARQAYLNWNNVQYSQLPEVVDSDAEKYIYLIPLFLQLNHKLLPGYSGLDVPTGVYAYKPDSKSLAAARLLNNKFRYQQEGVIKNSAIDSVFFQQQIMDRHNLCWIFIRSGLNKNQRELVREKADKISKWFSVRGLKIEFICLSDEEFRNNNTRQMSSPVYLDEFYSESVLLAGKYPVWWLVSPSKEKEYTAFVEHIKQARFVDNNEFIDLGSLTDLNRADLLYYAVDLVQKIKQSPEICLVKLLIIDHKNTCWPDIDGVACRIKKKLYAGDKAVQAVAEIADILHETFSRYENMHHILSPERLFSRLRNIPGKLNLLIVEQFLGDEYMPERPVIGIDSIIVHLGFFKAVAHEVRQVFSNIVTYYSADKKEPDSDPTLASTMRNMLVFLSDNADQVPLYNSRNKSDVILDRILLKHEIINGFEERWSLLLEESTGNEKKIEGFSSLLGLLSWCWLNRLVDHSTQVSVDCPMHQVKQIEAYYMLEVLMQQLKPELVSAIPAEAFENPVRPLQSLLFVNFMTENKSVNPQTTALELNTNTDPSETQVTHSEQLIINSWGEACTRQYTANEGVLKCLCEWTHHASLDSLSKPQRLMIFGHGEGDSTYMSQRVEQIYTEMLAFFYQGRHNDGCFIVRMEDEYYCIAAENSLLNVSLIGRQSQLMHLLEAPLKKYRPVALERLAYIDYPLREMYQLNQPDILQLFYQVINQSCYVWVLDEKGSLWNDIVPVYERENYITHWLYFFRNILIRLKAIDFYTEESLKLEIKQISINQFGGTEFYTVGADALTARKQFLDLQISINNDSGSEQLSLVCEGRNFSYQELGKNALIECVQYMSARMMREGRLAVYITDIDVPLSLFNIENKNDIQLSHILKFKRNFEHRINKLLAE